MSQSLLNVPREKNIWDKASVPSFLLITLSMKQAESTAKSQNKVNGLSCVAYKAFKILLVILNLLCVQLMCGCRYIQEKSAGDGDP